MPTTFDYSVLGSGDGSPPAAGAPSADGTRPYVTAAERAFLGFGLVAPLRRDQKGDFATAAEADLVLACVAQVLGTRCAALMPGAGVVVQGELPWRPAFGSRLYTLLHRNLDDPVTRQLARVYAGDALAQWEPRFRVKGVELHTRKSAAEAVLNTLIVRVVGDVIRANVAGNRVVLANAHVDVGVHP